MTQVVHLTSAHPRFDTRIYRKQCVSLASNGYSVTLIVADGKGDEVSGGVKIVDAGASSGRLSRMLRTTRRVYDKAIRVDADIYHLHDPELIPTGLKLKRRGKTVLYDVHEDYPNQIRSKIYLNRAVRSMASRVFAMYEHWASTKIDATVAVTEHIRANFPHNARNTTTVCNYPVLGELVMQGESTGRREEVCYIGYISKGRGICEMVQALGRLRVSTRLNLGGTFSEAAVEAEVKRSPHWGRVNELGFLSRSAMRDVLARSAAGLVVFHPLSNNVHGLPNKMFEYMSAGVPVIASDFPLWREIVEGNKCGICVNPRDPEAIAGAIDYLVSHPEIAQQMGENGRQAVATRYNWDNEKAKLLKLYRTLASPTSQAEPQSTVSPCQARM